MAIKKLLAAVGIWLCAGVLFAYFVEYRFQPMLAACKDCVDSVWYGSDLIISLEKVTAPPPPGIHARFGEIGVRGLFARHDYPPSVAAAGGLALPIILLAGGVVLFIWQRKK